MLGTRAGRLRIIFRLPSRIPDPTTGIACDAPSAWPKYPLAYVEWYTTFTPTANNVDGMYRVSPAKDAHGRQQGSVIPLTDIRQSCMLSPNYGNASPPAHWTSSNVLDECQSFLVNNFQSKYAFQTIY